MSFDGAYARALAENDEECLMDQCREILAEACQEIPDWVTPTLDKRVEAFLVPIVAAVESRLNEKLGRVEDDVKSALSTKDEELRLAKEAFETKLGEIRDKHNALEAKVNSLLQAKDDEIRLQQESIENWKAEQRKSTEKWKADLEARLRRELARTQQQPQAPNLQRRSHSRLAQSPWQTPVPRGVQRSARSASRSNTPGTPPGTTTAEETPVPRGFQAPARTASRENTPGTAPATETSVPPGVHHSARTASRANSPGTPPGTTPAEETLCPRGFQPSARTASRENTPGKRPGTTTATELSVPRGSHHSAPTSPVRGKRPRTTADNESSVPPALQPSDPTDSLGNQGDLNKPVPKTLLEYQSMGREGPRAFCEASELKRVQGIRGPDTKRIYVCQSCPECREDSTMAFAVGWIPKAEDGASPGFADVNEKPATSYAADRLFEHWSNMERAGKAVVLPSWAK